MNFLTGKDTTKLLGIHQQTLYKWEKKNEMETIRTIGGKRLYNVKKYLENKGMRYNEETKEIEQLKVSTGQKKICYCRVSSYNQKDGF